MQKIQKSRVLDMTDGSPAKLLMKFAFPLFCGNLLQQFYNLADTAIAGNVLGDTALAQIGATAALYSLITNFAFGMNNGLALTVSREMGAGNEKKMKEAVCWMTILSLFSAAILTGGFLIFSRPLLEIMQVPLAMREGALAYLVIILAGIPFTMIYNLEASLMQAVGNSATPLYFLCFSTCLNIGADVAFMGPLGFGVRGAALATVLSQAISGVLGFFYIWKSYPQLHFTKEERNVSRKFVRGMLTAGLGMAFMSALYNIGSVVLQGSINALGSVYIAAQVGGRKLAELFYTPGLAIGTAMATYASQNYGAEKRRKIWYGTWMGCLLYFAWWGVALVFVFTAAPVAVRLITGSSDPEVLENGLRYLQISIPMMPPMGVLILVRSALQGMGRTFWPLLCSTVELIGKVFFALVLVPVYGYTAVCICEPVLWVICMIGILFGMWRLRVEFQDTLSGREKRPA